MATHIYHIYSSVPAIFLQESYVQSYRTRASTLRLLRQSSKTKTTLCFATSTEKENVSLPHQLDCKLKLRPTKRRSDSDLLPVPPLCMSYIFPSYLVVDCKLRLINIVVHSVCCLCYRTCLPPLYITARTCLTFH